MHPTMVGWQDDCLISITDDKPLPQRSLRSLPPWRAVLIARVALKAGTISQGEVDSLVEEAKKVGGNGSLKLKAEKKNTSLTELSSEKCKFCKLTLSNVWFKCCPFHTTEQGDDIVCINCVNKLHIQPLLSTLDLPRERLNDFEWLRKNLLIHHRNPDAMKALEFIISIVKE